MVQDGLYGGADHELVRCLDGMKAMHFMAGAQHGECVWRKPWRAVLLIGLVPEVW